MRQLMKCLITLLMTLSVSMGSYGALRGNDVISECTGEGSPNFTKGFCAGAIVGLNNMHSVKEIPLYCSPDGANYQQFVKVVYKYMKQRPEELHNLYSILVLKALMEAFPCEG